MEFKSLSIKNFIGDLPNIVNTNFQIVKKFVEKIFDDNTDTLTATNVRAQSKIYANTIIANNIIINLDNGKTLSLAEILEKLDRLQSDSNVNPGGDTNDYPSSGPIVIPGGDPVNDPVNDPVGDPVGEPSGEPTDDTVKPSDETGDIIASYSKNNRK